MKKRVTAIIILGVAALCIIRFAVVNKQQESEYEKCRREYVNAKIKEQEKSMNLYCIQPGGEFSVKDSNASAKEESLSEQLSQEKQQLIDEVISKISIKQSVGLTKEEFVLKMEKLDEICGNNTIYLENADALFQMAQEEKCNEYLLPAICWLETVGGKCTHGDFNYYNASEVLTTEDGEPVMAFYDPDTKEPLWKNFESGEHCIQTFFEKFDLYYGSDTTLTQFCAKFAPNTAMHPHQAEDYAIRLYELMIEISNL